MHNIASPFTASRFRVAGLIVAGIFLFSEPASAATGWSVNGKFSSNQPQLQTSLAGKRKKKKPLPKITITYTGVGSATLYSENKAYSHSMPCRLDKTVSAEVVDTISWQVLWNKISIATKSGIPSTIEKPFGGIRSLLNEEYADLTSCPPFQLNDCQRQDPACLTFRDYCSASDLSQPLDQPSKLLVRKIGKLYEITVSAESYLQAVSFDPFNFSSCLRTSLFDNPIVDGNFGRLTRVRFLVKPYDKVRRTFLPVEYIPSHNCQDPAVQALKFDYTCVVQNKLEGAIEVVGKWKVVSKVADQSR